MNNTILLKKSQSYLSTLCQKISQRCVGSNGNRKATEYFSQIVKRFGWNTSMPGFDVMDWQTEGAKLKVEEKDFEVLASPYSLDCDLKAPLITVSNIKELERIEAKDKIVLLHGEIAKEQLMPKNFVFYNPESHQKIIALLEKSGAKAIICATGRNSSLAGGVYPFPLIEDGDFDIPSVYMTEEEGRRLLPYQNQVIELQSIAKRIPGEAYNVIATKGNPSSGRIVITAHIDAKKGTPGAIDNATGVIVLLLLAELLINYNGNKQIELVAFNGEDYYSVPGQMNYIAANQESFENILLNINIDGAGYKVGESAFSFFSLPEKLRTIADEVLQNHPDITEGIQWPQGDHSIFVQFGRPAIAVSSKWFIDNIANQDITHTPKDNPEIVNLSKLVDIAEAIEEIVRRI